MTLRAAFIGLTTLDVISLVPELPQKNTKIVALDALQCTGGPATNAAITFAHLGGESHLLGALGKNPVASIVHQELGDWGIQVHDFADPEYCPPISTILITTDDGSRTVVSINASKKQLPADAFRETLLDSIQLILLDGHHMDFALRAIQAAKYRGIPVVLDGGSWKSGTEKLLPLVDVVIASADFFPPMVNPKDQQAILNYLSSLVPKVAITNGKDHILYRTDSEEGHLQVPTVQIVDTLGAGDIFHGAFCYSYLKHSLNSFAEHLVFGSKVAAESCRFFGPRKWMKD
jgi:sugar/nucleoside kinase (ribokinase family)